MMSFVLAAVFAVCELVDPFWGSGGTSSAPSEGMARGWNWEKAQTGNTFPGAVRPFGWVSVCGYSGGYSSGYGRFGCSSSGPAPEKIGELKLFGFTHFHHNGAGWIGSFQNYVLVQPFVGTPDLAAASSVRGETASPGYYAAELPDYGARFELTADRFAACHRYAFARGGGRVRIDFTQAGYRREIFGGRPTYAESVKDYEIAATANGEWSGFLMIGGLKRYFTLRTKGATGERRDGVLTLSFAGCTAETVIGFSDESAEESVMRAREAEKSGFESVRKSAAAEWEDLLGGIRAEFAQESDARRFYSALYQSCIKPVEYRPGRFVEFATTWDTYRTQLPLVLSLCPKFARPLAFSMLKTSEELGYFPNCYLHKKRLSHNDVQASALGAYVMADACFRGLLDRSEYPRVKAFFEREFRTTDISKRSLSHALDLGGACHAAADVARMNGDGEAAAEWESSAAVWKSAYDPATGLLRRSDNFYEGSERNYSFRPHVGMAGRISLAGGREKFERMLEDFFAVDADFSRWTPRKDRLPRPGRFEGLNNEADMDAPLCWFWVGRSDRVAEVHDLVRRCRFADGEGGLPGNNDGGGTSSWYVWSCLGLRPLAGTPYVFLVSPTVARADIPFGAGRLSIAVERESAKSIYPVGFVFNGREIREPWLQVADLVKGGRLVFRLADRPTGRSPVPGDETAVVRPVDDGRALCNPDMGWVMHYYDNGAKYGTTITPGDSLDWYPGCNIVYLRLPWSWLEPEEGKYNWNAIDTPAQRWIERGGQVAFRVTVSETMKDATPGWVAAAGAKIIRWNWKEGPKPDGKFWECVPDDPVFLEKYGNFLKALAARYDGRREVAFVDVGSLGIWGEGHTKRTIRLSPEETQRIAKLHMDLHRRHFRKTTLVVNDDFTCSGEADSSEAMDYALSLGFGWRDDSIMVGGPGSGGKTWYHEKQALRFAKRAQVILEIGHYTTIRDWGNWSAEALLGSIEAHQASYLSIHGDPRLMMDENEEAIRRSNLRLGYRFQVREVAWPKTVVAGTNAEPFRVRFAFANAGAAQCRRDAFPCVTLKNAKGGIIAVLADGSFNLRDLSVAAPGRAEARTQEAEFTLGRWNAPVTPPGDYEVFVSVGEADGTPVFELPYGNEDGHRRYRLGRIRIESGK